MGAESCKPVVVLRKNLELHRNEMTVFIFSVGEDSNHVTKWAINFAKQAVILSLSKG